MLKNTVSGILAGTMIAIGGTVYLSLAGSNKIIGAILFSVALLCICKQGYSLYTGKIGFVLSNHSKEDMSVVWFGLLGNFVATVIFGVTLSYAIPSISVVAAEICKAKLTQGLFSAFIRAVFCGMLMYQAVSIFKKYDQNLAGIFLCIPVFILSGFEHSIANMFYFAAARSLSIEVIIYIITVILGNSVGGMFFELLALPFKKNKKSEDVE